MRRQGKSFVAEFFERQVVVVQGRVSFTDDEWDELIEFYKEMASRHCTRVIVWTDGGAPNRRQRLRLQNALRYAGMIFAIMTPSTVARAIGTAIGWFLPTVGVFGPQDVEQAIDFLRATPEDRGRLREALATLRADLATLASATAS